MWCICRYGLFVWFWNRNHTWAPVCGSFHLENYLLVFHPSFYLIHQWQWNRLGVNRANRVASLLSLMSYSPWNCPSPESSWGNLVKTVSLLMVMSLFLYWWLCHCFFTDGYVTDFCHQVQCIYDWEANQWYVKIFHNKDFSLTLALFFTVPL